VDDGRRRVGPGDDGWRRAALWYDGRQRAGPAAHRHMHGLAGRSSTTAGGGSSLRVFFSFTNRADARRSGRRRGVGWWGPNDDNISFFLAVGFVLVLGI
jgi:hypothetical protein